VGIEINTGDGVYDFRTECYVYTVNVLKNSPRIDTDEHGLKSKSNLRSSVFICGAYL
jgi:hypothetical protein